MKKFLSILKTQRSATAMLCVSTAALLGGCFSSPAGQMVPSTFHNQIQISESIERLELYARPNGMELSARDQDAVAQFIATYGQFGDGPLYINMPALGQNGLGTQQAAQIVRQAALQMGVGGAIQSGQYQTRPGSPAPVVVSYRRLKTIANNCRQLSDLMSTDNNMASPQWGCSHNANLAAMVQNPRQLLEPYAMGPSNAERRLQVHDKYIAGELTASEFPERQVLNADDE